MQLNCFNILECLKIGVGFSSVLARETLLQYAVLVLYVAIAILVLLLSVPLVFGELSTGISQLLSSTVNFTLPYVR